MIEQTNQAINEAVALKLGWTLEISNHDNKRRWNNQTGFVFSELADYCTDIAAAWEVVEKMASEERVIQLVYVEKFKRWFFTIGNRTEKSQFDGQAEADTAPRAICLAFLKVSA